jgi:hypothetical protein
LPVQRGGLLGPRLTTLVAYLKGVCHASFSTVRKFLRDVVGLAISRGQMAKVIAKVSEVMEQAWRELLDDLPGQARLNGGGRAGLPNPMYHQARRSRDPSPTANAGHGAGRRHLPRRWHPLGQ